MFTITYCVKLQIVCKITHWVKNYSLCVKSHTVCEITHILQDSTGVPFALNMEKNSSHFKIFTLTPLVALATNIRYGQKCKHFIKGDLQTYRFNNLHL